MRPALLLLTDDPIVAAIKIADEYASIGFTKNLFHDFLSSTWMNGKNRNLIIGKTPKPLIIAAVSPSRFIGMKMRLLFQILLHRFIFSFKLVSTSTNHFT